MLKTEVLNFKRRGLTQIWFVGGSPAVFKKEGKEIYRSKHLVKGLYYNDKFTNESRNVAIVKDRLYFVTEGENALVEYDLPLLDDFIKEGMDYHPRKLADSNISDYFADDPKNVWTLTSNGDLAKVKSFHGRLKSLEYTVKEEEYPDLYFTCLSGGSHWLVTAAHDEASDMLVFHLFNKELDFKNHIWVIPAKGAIGNSHQPTQTSSSHVHSMVQVTHSSVTYIVAGSYQGSLHLLAVINKRLHKLEVNWSNFAEESCSKLSSTAILHGITLLPRTSIRPSSRNLALDERPSVIFFGETVKDFAFGAFAMTVKLHL